VFPNLIAVKELKKKKVIKGEGINHSKFRLNPVSFWVEPTKRIKKISKKTSVTSCSAHTVTSRAV
jgi:hypothetical protein